MRIYQPAGTVETLERLLADPQVAEAVVAHRVIPERAAQTAPFPGWLDKRLVRALHARGIEMLYTHQAEALAELRAGNDIVVVTPTASGKSLCYDLPVLQSVVDDPAARALYLFPTKALSQDQLACIPGAGRLRPTSTVAAGVYDGDTPGPIRTNIRAAGQVVVTNPDMLHSAILPHHTKWFQLFEQLRYIVVDEAHTYRGIFGSHVANVLRRLLRLCEHYGSTPQIVCCSATIGNPQELAEIADRPADDGHRPKRRAGRREAHRHSESAGDRPAPGHTPGTARTLAEIGLDFPARRSPDDRLRQGTHRCRAAADGPARGISRGLRAAEADTRLSQRLPTHGTARDRGGAALGRGPRGRVDECARARASTSDGSTPSILAGYPGTIAATWQQMGRSGRRREPSVAILVAGADAVDQFVAHHPEYIFDATPEEARLDPTNLHVLLAHVRAATFEMPFDSGASFSGVPDGRPAALPRGGGTRPPRRRRPLVLGERELPGVGGVPARRCAGERGHHRRVGASAAHRHRRGRPVRCAGPRLRQRHLPARVAPVPRRASRLGGAHGRTSSRSMSTTTRRHCSR